MKMFLPPRFIVLLTTAVALIVAPSPSSSLSMSAPRSSRIALQGEGVPSKPGWRSDRIDRITEWADSKVANRPIIKEYSPSGTWLWSRYSGTVLKLVLGSVLISMATSLGIDVMTRRMSDTTWGLLSVPPPTEGAIRSLTGLEKLWTYQLTLCSFILSFFTSQAFAYWQKVYNTSRMIQGRINDFCMLLTMSAERTEDRSGYTYRSLNLVRRCTRLIRMSHTLFWASTPTASNGLTDSDEFITDSANCSIPIDDEHIGPLMLSSYGLKALVDSGQLTKSEVNKLLLSYLPPSQYPYVLLEWVGIYCMRGMRDDILVGTYGLENNVLQQLIRLRASMFDIDDFRAGRMPLAYVQLVQVLVDSLIMMAPFALYPELGTLSVPLVGLLALFFRGLLALSKSFLDPFGVEGFDDQTMKVDVLVSELNFGASKRWIQAGASLPEDDDDDGVGEGKDKSEGR